MFWFLFFLKIFFVVVKELIGITEITISKEALYSVSALISNEVLNTNPDSVEHRNEL